MNFAHLLPSTLRQLAIDWIKEDIPSFDYGGYVVGEAQQTAHLFQKAKGVLAGVPFFEEIFKECNCTVEWKFKEGDFISCEDGRVLVAVVKGKARELLIGERTALNLLSRASGIATISNELKLLKDQYNWHGIIAGTRKTTPGFRMVEKYAMLVGGIDTHRMDLSSMIMIKDNHIWATGSITNAVERARSVGGFALKIEVECGSLEEAFEAVDAGADIIMLDNFDAKGLKFAAKELKTNKMNRKFMVEASGGLTKHNCRDYFCKDIDILSFGSVSQSVPHIDFSLKIIPNQNLLF